MFQPDLLNQETVVKEYAKSQQIDAKKQVKDHDTNGGKDKAAKEYDIRGGKENMINNKGGREKRSTEYYNKGGKAEKAECNCEYYHDNYYNEGGKDEALQMKQGSSQL